MAVAPPVQYHSRAGVAPWRPQIRCARAAAPRRAQPGRPSSRLLPGCSSVAQGSRQQAGKLGRRRCGHSCNQDRLGGGHCHALGGTSDKSPVRQWSAFKRHCPRPWRGGERSARTQDALARSPTPPPPSPAPRPRPALDCQTCRRARADAAAPQPRRALPRAPLGGR